MFGTVCGDIVSSATSQSRYQCALTSLDTRKIVTFADKPYFGAHSLGKERERKNTVFLSNVAVNAVDRCR